MDASVAHLIGEPLKVGKGRFFDALHHAHLGRLDLGTFVLATRNRKAQSGSSQQRKHEMSLARIQTLRAKVNDEPIIGVYWLAFPEELNLSSTEVMYNGSEVFWTHVQEDISAPSLRKLATVLSPEQWQNYSASSLRNVYVCGRCAEEDEHGNCHFREFDFRSITPGLKDTTNCVPNKSRCAIAEPQGMVNGRHKRKRRERLKGRYQRNGNMLDNNDSADEYVSSTAEEVEAEEAEQYDDGAKDDDNAHGVSRRRRKGAHIAANGFNQSNGCVHHAPYSSRQKRRNARLEAYGRRQPSRRSESLSSDQKNLQRARRMHKSIRENGNVLQNGYHKSDNGVLRKRRKSATATRKNGVVGSQAEQKDMCKHSHGGGKRPPGRRLDQEVIRHRNGDKRAKCIWCDVCLNKVTRRCARCSTPGCASSAHRGCLQSKTQSNFLCHSCEEQRKAGENPHGVTAHEAYLAIQRCKAEEEARENDGQELEQYNQIQEGYKDRSPLYEHPYRYSNHMQDDFNVATATGRLNQYPVADRAEQSEEESPLCESRLNCMGVPDVMGSNECADNDYNDHARMVSDVRRARSQFVSPPPEHARRVDNFQDEQQNALGFAESRGLNLEKENIARLHPQHQSGLHSSAQPWMSARAGVSANDVIPSQTNMLHSSGHTAEAAGESPQVMPAGVPTVNNRTNEHAFSSRPMTRLQQLAVGTPQLQSAGAGPPQVPPATTAEKAVDTRSPPAECCDEQVQCDLESDEPVDCDKHCSAGAGKSINEQSLWAAYVPKKEDGTLIDSEQAMKLRDATPTSLEDWHIHPEDYDDMHSHELLKRRWMRNQLRQSVSFVQKRRLL